MKAIESRINHDVKAVEYYVREQLAAAGATRGDARARALRLHFRRHQQSAATLDCCWRRVPRSCPAARPNRRYAAALRIAGRSLPMLARTHGQPASPPHSARSSPISPRAWSARGALEARRASSASGMARWATSTRHVAAFRAADWPGDRTLVRDLAAARVQRAHHPDRAHDWIAEYCDAHRRAQHRARSACAATSGATSPWAISSSARSPAKWAPRPCRTRSIRSTSRTPRAISVIANALLRHFPEKLPDLALAARSHRFDRAAKSRCRARALRSSPGARSSAGLAKIDAEPARLAADVDGAWEVLAEPVQTVLRALGRAQRLRATQGVFAWPRHRCGRPASPSWTGCPCRAEEKARLKAPASLALTSGSPRSSRAVIWAPRQRLARSTRKNANQPTLCGRASARRRKT